MAGMIMGLTTLVGFDSAANLAEEAKDPFRSVPRAIVASVIAAAVAGLLFLIALTVAIKDIAEVTTSGSPVAAIIRSQLGPVAERILLGGIAFAMFGAGMVVMAACSRQVFAMARDARFPAHALMRKVNPRTQTPVFATILILVVGVVLMLALPGQALLQLILGSTILPALIYGAIVVLYLAVRRRLESKEGAFNLGRLDLPVAVAALVWIVLALFVLVTPDDALIPSLIVIGLILARVVYFAKMMIFNSRSRLPTARRLHLRPPRLPVLCRARGRLGRPWRRSRRGRSVDPGVPELARRVQRGVAALRERRICQCPQP